MFDDLTPFLFLTLGLAVGLVALYLWGLWKLWGLKDKG